MSRPRPPVPAGPHLVVGLARSGEAAALALRQRGEQVIGVDQALPGHSLTIDATVGRLRAAGVEVRLGDSGLALLSGPEPPRALIKSPGVPAEAPVVAAARAAGLPVLGELELAWRLLPHEFVAVTGTNGKTTTVQWLGHVHRAAGVSALVAGNVGTPLSSLVGRTPPGTVVICEASSFQLEDSLAFSPEAAALLNLTPDHLDRHGTLERYRAAKLQIFARQGNDDIAVAPEGLMIEDLGGCARRVCFGSSPGAELADRAGHLWWDGQALLATDELALPGAHNRQNAMAVAALCLARGMDPQAVRDGLRSFAGVPHRLERVAEHDGVSYINDSKATNVASTVVALRSFQAPVHLIAGGRGKDQDFTALSPVVAERCRAVYLIGEATSELAQALHGAGVPLHQLLDLPRALSAAREAARPGEVVLLSPACASFDQYRDFEERGDYFRTLAAAEPSR